MTSPKIITTTDDFAQAIKVRRDEMGLSHIELERRAGLVDGHMSKIEAFDRHWGKAPLRMGFISDLVLQTLGLALVVMPREEAERLCEAGTERRIRQLKRDGQDPKKEVRLAWVVRKRPTS